jgi:hypothetical protein
MNRTTERWTCHALPRLFSRKSEAKIGSSVGRRLGGYSNLQVLIWMITVFVTIFHHHRDDTIQCPRKRPQPSSSKQVRPYPLLILVLHPPFLQSCLPAMSPFPVLIRLSSAFPVVFLTSPNIQSNSSAQQPKQLPPRPSVPSSAQEVSKQSTFAKNSMPEQSSISWEFPFKSR